MNSFLFTSESVSEGHPDKICDQISDAVLDAILEKDKNSRVACECLVTTGQVIIAGEIRTETYVDVEKVARDVIRNIGYTDSKMGFDADGCGILSYLHQQSPDIAMGVDVSAGSEWQVAGDSNRNLPTTSYQPPAKKEQGAGDQGLMFGFAVNETKELMPLPIMMAHKILRRLSEARKSGEIPYLRPDAKSQVTIEYRDDKPFRVDSIVLSTQHSEDVTNEVIREDMIERIIRQEILNEGLEIDDSIKYFINPTGRFVIGGPHGDCGLTGRKIIVDSYGGMGRHGGGCFSGKDPSKVDRSAAYAARYIAKNIVAAGLADKCEVQLAYAIGVAEPVSISLNTFGTGKVDEEKLSKMIPEIFPVKPADIIRELNLLNTKYLPTAAYGHFGREEFSWEKTDKVERLQSL